MAAPPPIGDGPVRVKVDTGRVEDWRGDVRLPVTVAISFEFRASVRLAVVPSEFRHKLDSGGSLLQCCYCIVRLHRKWIAYRTGGRL